jgi:predicted CopG family antitoxin
MRLRNVYNSVYIYTYMSTKTISITKDVYDMLLVEKEEDESFSDVISRIVKRRSKLSDSFGKWEMTNEEIQKFKSELHNMWQEWKL